MDSFTRASLRFEVTDAGAADGDAVVLLHGFPADRHGWEAVSTRLVAAGYRTLAPEQRGYSPGARPSGRRAYRVEELVADVTALADAAGLERFHLVGHDWGAVVAWQLATVAPERVATLTAVSVPHPRAMLAAMAHGSQALHSWYMLAFQLPWIPERLLARRDGQLLARSLRGSGLGGAAAARYAARAAEPAALRGPINWYRALPFAARQRPLPVSVPTVLVWGPGDRFVTRGAIERSADWVRGPYRLVEVPGGTHWLPEEAPDAVADAVVQVAGDHPV